MFTVMHYDWHKFKMCQHNWTLPAENCAIIIIIIVFITVLYSYIYTFVVELLRSSGHIGV